jgi:hypothetical protein
MSTEVLLAVLSLLIAAGGVIAAIAAVTAKGAETRRTVEQECDEKVRILEIHHHRELETRGWD